MDDSFMRMMNRINASTRKFDNIVDIANKFTKPLTLAEQVFAGLNKFDSNMPATIAFTKEYTNSFSRDLALSEAFKTTNQFSNIGLFRNDHIKTILAWSLPESNLQSIAYSHSQTFLSSISAVENAMRSVNFLTKNDYFIDNWITSLQSIIEDSMESASEKEASELQEILGKLLSETADVFNKVATDSKAAFYVFATFITKILDSKTLARTKTVVELIMLVWAIYTTLNPVPPQTSVPEAAKVVSASQFGASTYITNEEKYLYSYARTKSKILTTIPINTEIIVLKKYKIWAWVAYLDQHGASQCGWTKIIGMNEL